MIGTCGGHRLKALTEVTRAFAEATSDYDRLLDVIARRTSDVVGDACIVALVSDDRRLLVPCSMFARDPEAQAQVRALLGASPVPLDAPPPSFEPVIARGQSLLVAEVPDAMLVARFSPALLPAARALRIRSLLTVALRIRGEFIGALSILRHGEEGEALTEADVALAEALAAHAAFALSNARLLASERSLREAAERAEAGRRAAEAHYRQLAENIREIFWISDADTGATLYVSPAFEENWGRRADGRPPAAEDWERAIHPDDRDRMIESASAHAHTGGDDQEFRVVRPDGAVRWLRARTFPVRDDGGRVYRVAGIAEDVTERRELEAQLRHAQKMEAVGRLAGGVAHDFNNLLSVILGYAEMALGGLPEGDPMRDDIGEIQRAAERAAGLTRQLLVFSRKQIVAPKVLDLTEVVAGTEKMLRRLVGEDVELTLRTDGHRCRCRIDPGHIEQVVMNLVVNARDAMPMGGALAIETAAVEFDAGYARAHVGVASGPYVMLAVRDTGCGMDKATQARVFEPFFTTKPRGTGLGLATVFGIVQQAGGHIALTSEVGVGTTFSVFLPCVHDDADVAAEPSAPPPSRADATILLVEDEDAVRALARTALRREGYCVLDASNGGEAILLSEGHEGAIDLLVTDVVMPRMNGRQLAERLASLRPAMRVLFTSGYTDDAMVQHGVLASDVSFLPKPLTPTALIKRVREVLDAGPAPR